MTDTTESSSLRDALCAARLRDIRKASRRGARYFRARARANRQWYERRDGSQGAAGPCKRLDPVTGALLEVVPCTDG
jgi:hypothetical protein